MDELIQHCLRELSYDGDLGEFHALFSANFAFASSRQGVRICLCAFISYSFHVLICLFIGTGSNVTRLQESIGLFYTHRSSSSQKIDGAYCAYVWAILVQQPNIRVGVVPEGARTEVYIAPQNSAKRKAKAKGEQIIDAAPVALQIISNATMQSLDELNRDYGENLRIAVDPDTIFTALTGSHIRVCCFHNTMHLSLTRSTTGVQVKPYGVLSSSAHFPRT